MTTQTKTFSDRSNCARAAKKEIGGQAKPGVDFQIVPVEMLGGAKGFRWELITALQVVAPIPADSAKPGAAVKRLFEDRAATLADIRASLGTEAKAGEDFVIRRTARGEWFWRTKAADDLVNNGNGLTPKADALPKAAKATAKPGTGKQKGGGIETLVALLSRADGASLAEITSVLPWKAHSARARIGSDLVRKGYQIARSTVEGRGRVYRIESAHA